MRKTIAAMLGVAVALTASAAGAQPFGSQGVFSISAERVFGLPYWEKRDIEWEGVPAPARNDEEDHTTFGLGWGESHTPYATPRFAVDYFVIDGLSVGDIGSVVLRNRRMLARDGIVVVIITINKQTGKMVGRPDIVSRGFVDTREAKEMLDESCELVARVLDRGGDRSAQWSFVNAKVRDTLNKFYYQQTKRRPMVLPFMVKV